MRPSFLLTLIGLSFALAHPGPHAPVDKRQLSRRQQQSKNCARQVAAMNEKRAAKRSLALAKRYDTASEDTTVTVQTKAPYFSTIQNDTCVLTPEVTTGPYIWGYSQVLRQDMSEDQLGVPLFLDIGVLDVNTCEPLQNALVDLWHCNATGSYSSFTGLDPNTPFEQLLDQLNVTLGNGTLDLHTDATTFLRGMWPTDSNGMMEMQTVFPGYYVERAIHIHVQVHTNWTVQSNGTLATGNTASTGQLFFDDETENTLMALQPYASHTQINRTLNSVDSIYSQENTDGFSSVMTVTPMDGVDIKNGLIGYVTLGVDSTVTDSGSGGI